MFDLQPASDRLAADPPCIDEFGVVPWDYDRTGALRFLLVAAREDARWTVPKGRLIAEMSPRETAMREAFNEAGAIGRVDPNPLGRFTYRRPSPSGEDVWHAATLFSMRVNGTLLNWPEKADRKRHWFEHHQALTAIDDPNLRNLLIRAFAAAL